jgi:hypothetical protein
MEIKEFPGFEVGAKPLISLKKSDYTLRDG